MKIVKEEKPIHYQDSGVNIKKADKFVSSLVNKTKSSAHSSIGGFAALHNVPKEFIDCDDPMLVMATDGVGTKLALVRKPEHHHCIGIDLVAMCVNDLICCGAKPLFFLDYYAMGRLDVPQANIFIDGVLDGCRKAGCELVGGETAEMPGFYPNNTYDVAGFCTGMISKKKIIRPTYAENTLLIGLASSGVHANGFSLVRKLLDEGRLNLTEKVSLGHDTQLSLAEALMQPTSIYVSSVLNLIEKGYSLGGIAHITGGGITENLPRSLPDDCFAEIHKDALEQFPTKPLFEKIQAAAGLCYEEMLRTFNCGVGMILAVAAEEEKDILAFLHAQGEIVHTLGSVVKRADGIGEKDRVRYI